MNRNSGLPMKVVRRMADLPADLVDERMEETRNRAFKQAYVTRGGLATLACPVGMLATVLLERPLNLSQRDILHVLFGVMLYTWSLPSTILAWSEPEI